MEHLFDNVYLFTPDSGQMMLYSDEWHKYPTMQYSCLSCGTNMGMGHRYYLHQPYVEGHTAFCADCYDEAVKEGKIVRG